MLFKTLFTTQLFQQSGIPNWVWFLIFLVVVVIVALAAVWNAKKSGEDVAAHAEHSRDAADDLTKIEGIGPKISSVFQAAGVTSFAAMAGSDVEALQKILDDAGIRLGDPATWPEQARIAANGEWAALEKLQDELQGGRRE